MAYRVYNYSAFYVRLLKDGQVGRHRRGQRRHEGGSSSQWSSRPLSEVNINRLVK